jgi:hypothetical protein
MVFARLRLLLVMLSISHLALALLGISPCYLIHFPCLALALTLTFTLTVCLNTRMRL